MPDCFGSSLSEIKSRMRCFFAFYPSLMTLCGILKSRHFFFLSFNREKLPLRRKRVLPRVFIQKDNKNLLLSTWRDDGIRARIRKLCALGTGLAEKPVKIYVFVKITCALYGYVSVIKSVILTPTVSRSHLIR